jgi:hypothetical protein
MKKWAIMSPEARELINAFRVYRSFVCLNSAWADSSLLVGDEYLQLGGLLVTRITGMIHALFLKFWKSLWEIAIMMSWENLSAEAVQVVDFQFVFLGPCLNVGFARPDLPMLIHVVLGRGPNAQGQ